MSLDLRGWVNSGLMTFFFVFGLEARREFDMGELRERRRVALPGAAGLAGLLVPVAIYLAANAGSASRGWEAAMSTDTAFALGMLALTRPRFPLEVPTGTMYRSQELTSDHSHNKERPQEGLGQPPDTRVLTRLGQKEMTLSRPQWTGRR